jgi:hypothetical protein
VTGNGKTFEEAKHQAFRKAIELEVGANVLSDIETQNYRRVKDEIYIYSSGYVDDYKVLSQEVKGNNVIVLLEVLVSENKIKNRIISVGKSDTDFDNQKHTAQVGTYIQERVSADRLLGKHLAEYPRKAYIIKHQPYNITLNEFRNPVLNIPYTLSWNYDYIKTLREIMGTIEHGSNGLFKNSESAIIIMVKDPKDFILGEKTVHKFNDLNTVNQVHNSLNGYNQVRIIVRLKDTNNNDIHAICYVPRFMSGYGGTFYDTGEPRIKAFYGNAKEQGLIKLPISLEIIDRTSKIELSIDADSICNR